MRCLAVILLLLVLAGCGYHFAGHGNSLPGEVSRVYLPLFANRTLKPQLENLLSNEVGMALARNGNIIEVRSKELAEAVLQGTVSSYATTAIAYDKNDDISEYRAKLTIEVSLRSIADGRLLWQGTVAWSEDYLADNDKARQRELERDAVEKLSRRIADELLSRMLDDF